MSLVAAGLWVACMTTGTMLYNKVRHPYRAGIERDLEVVFEAVGLIEYAKKIRYPLDIKKTIKTNVGYEITLQLPRTRTVQDVERVQDQIERALDSKIRIQANRLGLIKITIFTEPMPSNIPFDEDVLRTCRNTWKLPVGMDLEGWAFWDLQKIPHLLFGGVPGSGKTIAIRSIVAVAVLNHPEDVEIYISDGKACGDYNEFIGLPQVGDVVYTPDETKELLELVNAEMDRRSKQLREKSCDNIDEYNDLFPNEKMKRVLLVVDEMAQLSSDKEAQKDLARVAQLGRAPGIHLIGGTQRPDAKTINPQIKSLMDATLAFRVRNHTNSEILLDETEAESLPQIPGRCIFQTGEKSRVIQAPHASTASLRLMFLKNGARGKRADETGFKDIKSVDETGSSVRSRLRLADNDTLRDED